MVGLGELITKAIASFKPIQIHIDKIEQKIIINGKEINTDKYVENSGKFSFITRPSLPKENEKELDTKLFDTTDGFVNAELLQEEIITTKLFFTKSQIMKKYKHFLLEKDLSAVLLAYGICTLEDNNQKEVSSQAKEHLIKLYKERGRTIYNFVRSKLFETEILNKLNRVKREKADKLGMAKDFSEYFESIIAFHPTNIYVSVNWTIDDLLAEVSTRLNLLIKENDTQRKIKIYSRSSNITKVNKLKESGAIIQIFEITEEDYSFGKEKAKTTILKLKKV